MSFQYTREHFVLPNVPCKHTCERPTANLDPAASDVGAGELQSELIATIMVQTPNGAAMMVPVRRRPEAHQPIQPSDNPVQDPAARSAPLYVVERGVDRSVRRSAPSLLQVTSGRAQVAAAPDR